MKIENTPHCGAGILIAKLGRTEEDDRLFLPRNSAIIEILQSNKLRNHLIGLFLVQKM